MMRLILLLAALLMTNSAHAFSNCMDWVDHMQQDFGTAPLTASRRICALTAS